MKTTLPSRITQADAIQLSALVEALSRVDAQDEPAESLQDLLDFAQIVPADSIPADVVTLNSQVLFEDMTSGKRLRVTVVLPEALDPAAGRISVLSPMGRALLGRHVGEVVEVELPTGQVRHARLRAIPFQPEAHARHGAE